MTARRRRRIGEDEDLDISFGKESEELSAYNRTAREIRDAMAMPETETSQESCLRIAQDAVLVLRRELAFQAEMALRLPGTVAMQDLIQLLRLVKELGEATKDPDAPQQKANFDRLTPAERVQLAALQLKVTYE